MPTDRDLYEFTGRPSLTDSLLSISGNGRGENEIAPSLPFRPLAEVVEDVASEPEWLWQGFLAPSVITALAGRPKVGKSTAIFGLIASLAEGTPFLDLPTAEAGALLLTEERQPTLAEKEHRFAPGPRVHALMRHEVGARTWPEVVEDAIAYCNEHALGVLVVDVLDKWAPLAGDSENSAGAVIEALAPLQWAASSGLAVLVCTHQRKSGGQFGEAVRGSNALVGAVDVLIELERADKTLSLEGARILRTVSRFSSTPDELVCVLTDSGYEAHGDSLEAKAEGQSALILVALEGGAGTLKELTAELPDIPSATLRRRLDKLVAENRAKRDGSGAKGDPYRWQLILTSQNPVGEVVGMNPQLNLEDAA